MLMTAVHMDSRTTQPWLPVLTDQLLHHDFTPAASASSSPSTPPPAPSPHSHHHARLPRAASTPRRVAKRRPRPSRRLPTTYISADPASFRRMVHQVTGADHLPASALPHPSNNAEIPLLTRPAPVCAGVSATSPGGVLNTLLPTLDTSAFLVGALSWTRTDDGPGASAAAAPTIEPAEAGGACSSSSGSGFPTLESWDDHALF